jgi:hypothetical protein
VQVFADDFGQLPEPKRALVCDVFRFHRFVSIPKIKDGGDDNSNAQTTEKKPAVGRQEDQQCKHQGCRDNQACSASQVASGRPRLRIPFHANTLHIILSSLATVWLCFAQKLSNAQGAKDAAKDAKNNKGARRPAKRPACAGLA